MKKTRKRSRHRVRHTIGLIIFFVLALVVVCDRLLHSQTAKQIDEWWGGIVEVIYDNGRFGTGFFISKDGIVATSLHIIPGYVGLARDKLAVRINGEFYKAEIIYDRDKDVDLLLLKIDYKPEFWFDEFANPEPGMECIVLGYPLAWRAPLKTLIIQHINSEVLGVNEEVAPRSSGSVVLSMEGVVLGMIKSSHEDEIHGSFSRGVIAHSIFIRMGLEKVRQGMR